MSLDDALGSQSRPGHSKDAHGGRDDVRDRRIATMARAMREQFGERAVELARTQLRQTAASGGASETWQAILDALHIDRDHD